MDKNNGAIYDARKLGKPKMIILGIQHMFAMFGATILVPIITGWWAKKYGCPKYPLKPQSVKQ